MLSYLDTPLFCFYLLKQNRVIAADEIHERCPGIRTSTIETLRFRSDHPDKQCKLRSACSLGIGLIRVYTVAILSAHLCGIAITGQ